MSISEVIHGLNILYHKEPGRPIYDKELPALKEAIKILERLLLTEDDGK